MLRVVMHDALSVLRVASCGIRVLCCVMRVQFCVMCVPVACWVKSDAC